MISKHVAYREVVRSQTAKRRGIRNVPTDEQLGRIILLAQKVFEPLREHFGVPIFISSGFRSEELNKAMGGARGSQHMCQNGAAFDLDAQVFGKITNEQIFDYIRENLDYDQLIAEGWDFEYDDYAWIHVSYKEKGNRNEVLVMRRINGKTIYSSYYG